MSLAPIVVDLTGVEVKSFAPLHLDRVICELKDIKEQTAKRSGYGKLQFIGAVVSDMDGNPIPDNRQVFYEVSLQQDAKWNLKRTLIALGDDPEDLEAEISIEKEDYVGRKFVAALYLDSSAEALGKTGEPKEKVSQFLPMPVEA